MPVSTKGAMAEPSHPSGRPLELEDRRSRAPAETVSKRPMPLSPLAMERWAIVLRRHRAGYAGYEQVDPRALALARRSHPADTSMLKSLVGRLRSLGQGRKGEPRPSKPA
jgi:hypothetical protein